MNRLRFLRIVATFIGVFALGALTGWKLHQARVPAEPGVGRIEVSAEGALTRLSERLGLTSEQETRLRPLFVEWSHEAGGAGGNQRRRLALFEQNVPRIREALRETQREAFDLLIAEARQRFHDRLQRRARPATD